MDSSMIAVGQEYLAGIYKQDDDAEHVGVKGMRWGVRRSRSAKAVARKEALDAHNDHKLARELSTKKLSKLSNDELRKLNERLNLEQQYLRLNPSQSARRKKKIDGYLAQIETAQKVWKLVPEAERKKIAAKGAKKFTATIAKLKAI